MIVDLFSKRQKRLRGEVSDVYQYDEIPEKLRIQITRILPEKTINYYAKTICKILKDEYGRDWLTNKDNAYNGGFYDKEYSASLELHNFIRICRDTEEVLDALELICRALSKSNNKEIAETINKRFQENGVGYEFYNEDFIRIDSKTIHQDVVKPVLGKLSENSDFQVALDEFLIAHGHYRHNQYSDALVNCLKSVESTMKIICDKRGFEYNPNDTAKSLIGVLKNNNFLEPFEQNSLNHLVGLLEGSIPTYRNKLAGHGQGNNTKPILQHTASYVFHMTASTILYLIECDEH